MKHIDEETLFLYMDGELPSPRAEKVREHLAGCLECRRLFKEYVAIGEAAKQDPDAIPWDIGAFTGAVMKKVNTGKRKPWFRPIPALNPRYFAAAAAVLLLALGGGVLLERVEFRAQVEAQTRSLVANHYTARMGDLGAFVELKEGGNQSAR